MNAIYYMMDANKDGSVSAEELLNICAHNRVK